MEPLLLLRVLPGPGRHPAGLALDPDQGPQGGGGPVAQLPPRGEEVADQLAAETLAVDNMSVLKTPFSGLFSNILVAASLAPPASSGQSVASSQPLLTLAVVSTTITSLLPGCSTSTDSVLVFLQPSPPSN